MTETEETKFFQKRIDCPSPNLGYHLRDKQGFLPRQSAGQEFWSRSENVAELFKKKQAAREEFTIEYDGASAPRHDLFGARRQV